MPTLIWSKVKDGLDPSKKKQAYAFFEKLQESDELPGLHIEPIVNSADTRVRTGRVDDGYRAVLFKITDQGTVTYVFHGIWPHDEANRVAERTTLRVNPVSGIAEIRTLEPRAASAETSDAAPTTAPEPTSATPETERSEDSLLTAYGLSVADLTALGLDEDFAQRAMTVSDEEGVLALADRAPADWQGLALIDLSTGRPVEEVKARLGLDQPVEAGGTEDEQLIRGLQHPASQLSFAWIEDDEELRRVVGETDFAAWRVFLHPLQKQFVDRDYNGPAKVTGGAGTGKTVVVLHRARRLAVREPRPRVLLTTFTRNLADALQRDMRVLDPDVRIVRGLGEPGLRIAGIDALARQGPGAAAALIERLRAPVVDGHASMWGGPLGEDLGPRTALAVLDRAGEPFRAGHPRWPAITGELLDLAADLAEGKVVA